MKYTIRYHNIEECVWNETKKPITQNYSDCIETDDTETCKSVIKTYVDPPDYILSDENLKKNFGDAISEESMTQIRNYYGFRKQIYGDFLEDINRNIRGIFRYEFPEEFNHYEVAKDAKYEERQIVYYIELQIEK